MIGRLMSGEPLGWSLARLEERVKVAASRGDRDARALVAAMVKAGRWPARVSRHKGISPRLLASWCCPTCGAAARSASGWADTVTCARGHARVAHPEERSPFLRKLLGQQ